MANMLLWRDEINPRAGSRASGLSAALKGNESFLRISEEDLKM
jgi:hypothetical protein